jgi:hypothetical protein
MSEYGKEILYKKVNSEDGLAMGAPEGSPRELKMRNSSQWVRWFKPLSERKELWEKKVAAIAKKPAKKKTREKKSAKKSS